MEVQPTPLQRCEDGVNPEAGSATHISIHQDPGCTTDGATGRQRRFRGTLVNRSRGEAVRMSGSTVPSQGDGDGDCVMLDLHRYASSAFHRIDRDRQWRWVMEAAHERGVPGAVFCSARCMMTCMSWQGVREL